MDLWKPFSRYDAPPGPANGMWLEGLAMHVRKHKRAGLNPACAHHEPELHLLNLGSAKHGDCLGGHRPLFVFGYLSLSPAFVSSTVHSTRSVAASRIMSSHSRSSISSHRIPVASAKATIG